MEKITKQHMMVGGAALAGVAALAGTAYFMSSSGTQSPRKARPASPRFKKYSKEFQELPRGVVWAGGEGAEDMVNLHVAGDTKNVDLGLKVGSMLIKVGSVQVAGKATQEVLLTLRRIKEFPVKLQFLEQPSHCEVWTQAMDLRAKGKVVYKDKKWEEALAVYNEALRLHPSLKLLYSNKILVLLQLNRPNEALEMSKEMLRLDPGFSKGHYRKGQTFVKLAELMLTKSQEVFTAWSILIRDLEFQPVIARIVIDFLDPTTADEDHMKSIFYAHAATEFRTTLKRAPDNKQAQKQLKECERLYAEVVKRIDERREKELEVRKRERDRLIREAQEKIQATLAEAAKKEEEAQEAVARAEKAEAEADALEKAAAAEQETNVDNSAPPVAAAAEDIKEESSDASYVEVEKPTGDTPPAEKQEEPVAVPVVSAVEEPTPAVVAAPTDEPEAETAAVEDTPDKKEEEAEEEVKEAVPQKEEEAPVVVSAEPEPVEETPMKSECTKEVETTAAEAPKPEAGAQEEEVLEEEDLEKQV